MQATTTTDLQARVQELEQKVQSLDRQVRSRNSTLACVLAAAGGSVRVAAPVRKQVLEDYAGATFHTEHDAQNDQYVVSVRMMPKPEAAATN